MDLIIPAGIVVVGLGTYAATIAAIRQYEKPKRNSLADIHDIHHDLPRIAPMPDISTRYLDDIFGGYRTGAWPMILELRKDTPALPARQRFTFHPTIEGQVLSIEAGPDANARPWLRGGTLAVATVSDRTVASAARELVEAGGRR